MQDYLLGAWNMIVKIVFFLLCLSSAVSLVASLVCGQYVSTSKKGFSIMIQTSPSYGDDDVLYCARLNGKWEQIRSQGGPNNHPKGFWSKDGTAFIVVNYSNPSLEFAYDFTKGRSYNDHRDIENLLVNKGGRDKALFYGVQNLESQSNRPWVWDIM